MKPSRAACLLSALAVALALASGAALALAGPLTRLGAWTFRDGFAALRWGACGGAAAAALSAALMAFGRWRTLPVLGLALGAGAFVVPWELMRGAHRFPPIHDISTDTADPPAFVAVLPLRKDAANPAEYGGPDVAFQQTSAYPDLAPLTSALPAPYVFMQALQEARAQGWRIIASAPASGRLEATDATPGFGFKDDVVVRVAARGAGSVVDVRSVSRVGKGDVGTNARRIRRFLAGLAGRLTAE